MNDIHNMNKLQQFIDSFDQMTRSAIATNHKRETIYRSEIRLHTLFIFKKTILLTGERQQYYNDS